MHHDESEKGNHERTEIRFAYNLLEKLLEYVDKAALNMQAIKESAGGDVKFFNKVTVYIKKTKTKIVEIILLFARLFFR